MMMTMMGFKSVNLIYYALFLTILVNVNASIHHYNNEPFTHRSNAFFFHAGTEAIFSSSSSFIRYYQSHTLFFSLTITVRLGLGFRFHSFQFNSGSKQCRSTDPENLLSPMAKCKPILVLLKQLFLKLKTETESTRRNLAKLEIYRKFTNTLAVSVLLSIAWIGFELYFNATDPLSELWQIAWIIPAFWSLLSYTLLLVICVLWAPSRNPTRYVLS
ncbi:hypothetical protein KIW84_054416 [Lathyrus oleraceus]|uniref:GOST seven transmembrane domain-containing protein n=1 Tax=Pisum sativum TaxID=3888 RepID=A0A9D5AEG9_PEA|nr:hypothetical protein KIW84_054416 [Pisum sativum]